MHNEFKKQEINQDYSLLEYIELLEFWLKSQKPLHLPPLINKFGKQYIKLHHTQMDKLYKWIVDTREQFDKLGKGVFKAKFANPDTQNNLANKTSDTVIETDPHVNSNSTHFPLPNLSSDLSSEASGLHPFHVDLDTNPLDIIDHIEVCYEQSKMFDHILLHYRLIIQVIVSMKMKQLQKGIWAVIVSQSLFTS